MDIRQRSVYPGNTSSTTEKDGTDIVCWRCKQVLHIPQELVKVQCGNCGAIIDLDMYDFDDDDIPIVIPLCIPIPCCIL